MSAVIEAPRKTKFSRASLEAGNRLLKAVKQRLLEQHGRIDFQELRRRGYSQATIARLKEI